MRWFVVVCVCVAACRPFDETLSAVVVRLSANDPDGGVSDAGSDAGFADAAIDAGRDEGPDAGNDSGVVPLDGGSDAGLVDAGPRCVVVNRRALTQEFGTPDPSAAIAVATAQTAWLLAMVTPSGAFQVAKYENNFVGVLNQLLGCSGGCLGVHLSRADESLQWYAAAWSASHASRWEMRGGAVPYNPASFSTSCGNAPGVLINADIVGGADGGAMAVGCHTGFSIHGPGLSTSFGDATGLEVRVARNESGDARLAWTTDAGTRLAVFDYHAGTITSAFMQPVAPALSSLALDVSPTGRAWIAGLNVVGGIQVFRYEPDGGGGVIAAPGGAPLATATVRAPVGLAADEQGAMIAYARSGTVYAQAVLADGGYERAIIVAASGGANPQIAWRRDYGASLPARYLVTWIENADTPMVAEVSCTPEP